MGLKGVTRILRTPAFPTSRRRRRGLSTTGQEVLICHCLCPSWVQKSQGGVLVSLSGCTVLRPCALECPSFSWSTGLQDSGRVLFPRLESDSEDLTRRKVAPRVTNVSEKGFTVVGARRVGPESHVCRCVLYRRDCACVASSRCTVTR